MVTVVEKAITISEQDFSVICGLRTVKEQEALVAKGASQTLKSKHLEGLAVDLMAYIDGGRWELNLYDEIADAIRKAAIELEVNVRWGAAWHKTLNEWDGTAEDLMNEYIDLRRSQGRRPFIDGPHFEIVE
jgi:peptidoglycan L-alanyl-D-glutamate endopeptidase CwlK